MPSVAYRLCENVEDYRVYPIDGHQHKKCRREPNSNLLPESTLMNPSNWGTSMADEKAFYAQNAPPLHPLRAKSFDVSMQNPRNCSSIQGPAGNIKAEHSCTIQHLFTHPDYFNGYQSSDFGFLEDIEQVRCRLRVLPHGRMADYNDPSHHVVIELVVDVAEEHLRHIMKCTVKPGNLPSESQTEIIEQQKVLFAFDELFSRDDWLMDPETDHEFTIHISVTVISTKFVKGKGDTRFGLLLDTMESLCKSGEGGDIIVCYGDVKFLAHKHVLCARSAKFASFLALSNVNTNELVLETKEKCELHPTAVRDLMFYFYTGQYPKRAGRNSCLKSLATFFKLDYLHNDCEAIEPNTCTQSFKMKSHLPEEFDKLSKEIVNFP